jgi:signal transduction histidine kinase/DNA-binding response OmpR family regulator
MSDDSTITYLHSFINRTENIQDLLMLFIINTNSRAGAMFIQEGIGNRYTCVEHINLDIIECTEPIFEPIDRINNILISNDNNTQDTFGLIANYDIQRVFIIPISVHKDYIGVLCLINRTSNYYEELINVVSPLLSLTQLILNKQKLIQDFKKLYSDSTYLSKDLFLANMSHEIRTPLNGVIGYNQLLMKTSLSATQKGYVYSMNQCSIQLMQIINDVLDFSKLSSGKMIMNNECFSIQDVIKAVNSAMGNRLIEKKQTLEFIVCDSIPEFIITDKHKLIQIIINLVSNSNKFTDINGLLAVVFNTKNNRLYITVSDNGIGISEQDQCKLFNTFVQIENSLCKSGTGLGLAICKKLLELLNGEITVESNLGVGSAFKFNIEFKIYEEFEKLIEQDSQILKDKVILVVDDNADNRILLSEMLFEWNITPIICASALEALRMVMGNRYNFSLGLIDICMPGTSGTELAKQIKEELPLFPLIALSSADSFINTSEFEQKLDKPINKVQLFDAIYKIISKNQTPSAYIGENTENFSPICSPSINHSKNIKILIAEDISYNQTLLINMLEILSYTNIDVSEDGQVAFEKIKKSHLDNDPYDILLLDLRMPIMNGYDVIEAMKRSSLCLPYIVVVTASVIDADREKCKQMGVKYFITKPIDLTQLKEVMLHVSGNL